MALNLWGPTLIRILYNDAIWYQSRGTSLYLTMLKIDPPKLLRTCQAYLRPDPETAI